MARSGASRYIIPDQINGGDSMQHRPNGMPHRKPVAYRRANTSLALTDVHKRQMVGMTSANRLQRTPSTSRMSSGILERHESISDRMDDKVAASTIFDIAPVAPKREKRRQGNLSTVDYYLQLSCKKLQDPDPHIDSSNPKRHGKEPIATKRSDDTGCRFQSSKNNGLQKSMSHSSVAGLHVMTASGSLPHTRIGVQTRLSDLEAYRDHLQLHTASEKTSSHFASLTISDPLSKRKSKPCLGDGSSYGLPLYGAEWSIRRSSDLPADRRRSLPDLLRTSGDGRHKHNRIKHRNQLPAVDEVVVSPPGVKEIFPSSSALLRDSNNLGATVKRRNTTSAVYEVPNPLDIIGYRIPEPVDESKSWNEDRFHPPVRIEDDKDGHLLYYSGFIIANEAGSFRYKVVSTLGEGTFGKVVRVDDLVRKRCMALKIIKNVDKYREAAKLEINVLERIQKSDPYGINLCAQMDSWFNFHGHTCLAFELLGISVFDFLKENNYEPYSLDQVRDIVRQVSKAVNFLHSCHVTHTDLKPENILFVSSDSEISFCSEQKRHIRRIKSSSVRLIDFGSATFEWEHHSKVVSTRHYRAPEIILEIGWSHPCDIWSLGCILFELMLGFTLFQTHDNKEHLAMMEKILGPLPHRMTARSKTAFYVNNKLTWNEQAPAAQYVQQNCRPINEYIPSNRVDMAELIDVTVSLLAYEPSERLPLAEIPLHRAFTRHPSRPFNEGQYQNATLESPSSTSCLLLANSQLRSRDYGIGRRFSTTSGNHHSPDAAAMLDTRSSMGGEGHRRNYAATGYTRRPYIAKSFDLFI